MQYLFKYIYSFLSIIFIFGCSSSEDVKKNIPGIVITDFERIEEDDGILQIEYAVKLNEVYTDDIILTYHSDDA